MKNRLIESKHLMWQPGMEGIPCVDATIWGLYEPQITKIIFHTDKGRTFTITKELFNKHKQELNLGFGRQFWVPKHFWAIKAPTEEDKLKRLSLSL